MGVAVIFSSVSCFLGHGFESVELAGNESSRKFLFKFVIF